VRLTSRALERAAIVLTPVLALATVAVGLRLGQSSRITAARVKLASPGVGRSGLWLQVVTLAEEAGVAELVEMPGLTVSGKASGAEARWHGGSNVEGVAEAWLDLPNVGPKAQVELTITAADGAELAHGVVVVPERRAADAREDDPSRAEARPTRREGKLFLEVFVYGGKLVTGSPTRVAVRVKDAATGHAVPGVHLTVDPEPGLSVEKGPPATDDGGWTEATVVAEYLVGGWTLVAAGASVETGTWYGSLPVSPGAATVNLPLRIDAGGPCPLRFVVPPATRRLYVTVDDAEGRDFGVALDARDGVADTELPPLAPGLYWLLTSADPHGAETLTGSTVARPFRIGPASSTATPELAALAERAPHATPEVIALDGLKNPRSTASKARKKGLAIALGAVAVATLLEILLVLRAASAARARMLALSEAALSAGAPAQEEGTAIVAGRAMGVVALVLVALLGFALLAALLVVSGQ
jgi:hypothetical protein